MRRRSTKMGRKRSFHCASMCPFLPDCGLCPIGFNAVEPDRRKRFMCLEKLRKSCANNDNEPSCKHG